MRVTFGSPIAELTVATLQVQQGREKDVAERSYTGQGSDSHSAARSMSR